MDILLDANLTIEDVDEMFLKQIHSNKSDLIGKNFLSILHACVPQEYILSFTQVFKAGKNGNYIFALSVKNKSFWLLAQTCVFGRADMGSYLAIEFSNLDHLSIKNAEKIYQSINIDFERDR